MSKRFVLVLTVLAVAVTLLGATGCSKKKMMMGSLERPAQSHVIG